MAIGVISLAAKWRRLSAQQSNPAMAAGVAWLTWRSVFQSGGIGIGNPGNAIDGNGRQCNKIGLQ